MNIKIFKARHGEGKTKWLVEQAQREYDAGKTCYCLGKYEAFANIWAATRYEACPIEFKRSLSSMPFLPKNDGNLCFFIDEFFLNDAAPDVLLYSKINKDATFYIAMDAENFVN